MSPVHVHLVLNHVPVIGVVFGLALLAYGRFARSEDVWRAALWTFVVVGVLSALTYLTGEGAEETVEHLAGVWAPGIEVHEETAMLATIAAAGLAMLALAEIILERLQRAPSWFRILTFSGAMLVAALMARTAYLGGSIRHTELGEAGPAVEQEGLSLSVGTPQEAIDH